MKFRLAPAWIAPLLLLAACEDEAPDAGAAETGGKAAGEILGGTISDEMIPLEELTSTSPPAARASGTPGAGGEADGGDGEGAETTEAEASEEAPAPETDTEE